MTDRLADCQSWWSIYAVEENSSNLCTTVFTAVIFSMAFINRWRTPTKKLNRLPKSQNYNFHIQYMDLYKQAAPIILVSHWFGTKKWYSRLLMLQQISWICDKNSTKLCKFKHTIRFSRLMKHLGSVSQISELISLYEKVLFELNVL